MKSNCCGAELVNKRQVESPDSEKYPMQFFVEQCLECKNDCRRIPSDIMSKKEIVEFCEQMLEIDFYYLKKHLKEILHTENLRALLIVLKSVKELMEEENIEDCYKEEIKELLSQVQDD